MDGFDDGCVGAGCEEGVDEGVDDPGNTPPLGASGAIGAVCVGASGLCSRVRFATSASAIDVTIKIVARMTVVRVIAFAAPRPVIRPPTPPPVPKPNPPPSERCRRITPIMAIQTRIWIVRRTINMSAGVSRGTAGKSSRESGGF